MVLSEHALQCLVEKFHLSWIVCILRISGNLHLDKSLCSNDTIQLWCFKLAVHKPLVLWHEKLEICAPIHWVHFGVKNHKSVWYSPVLISSLLDFPFYLLATWVILVFLLQTKNINRKQVFFWSYLSILELLTSREARELSNKTISQSLILINLGCSMNECFQES